jgi:choline dehydrogenase
MTSRYDYVIVGAGSAGCVLAARLTEDPDVRVALVEAGGPDSAPEIHIPLAFAQLFKTGVDWDYSSEPEPGLAGRRLYLPRGRMLGGSSSMNAMCYIRGNRADFDGWAGGGAKGWSYEEMLPYFIKSEGNERGAGPFHGGSGPLSVQDLRFRHPLVEAVIEAAVEAGHERSSDFNADRQDGFGFFQVTQHNGRRCSSATGYLHPALHRPNLDLITDALTTRIDFERTRAVGIEMFRYGKTETLRADREVIVSAGAYNSPQLLMLSGIGIASELKALGIATRQELPVGEDLQDHPLLVLSYFTDVPSLFGAGSEQDLALFQEGRGPLPADRSCSRSARCSDAHRRDDVP